MADSLLGELHDRESKQAVIDAICALFKRWHLHEVNQAQLLGLTNIAKLNRQYPEEIDAAVFTRMGNILAIDRALFKFFRYGPQNRERWIVKPSKQLDGETPLAVMLSDSDRGIRKIKQLAESLLDD